MNNLLASIVPAHALGIVLSGWNGHCIRLTVGMLGKSQTEYRAAVRSEMTASAGVFRDDIARISMELMTNGKSIIGLRCSLSAGGIECAAMEAQYVIMMKQDP